jgi:hypothetical protein
MAQSSGLAVAAKTTLLKIVAGLLLAKKERCGSMADASKARVPIVPLANSAP